MKKIKPSDLAGFINNRRQPYTDYNQDIVDWLRDNAKFHDSELDHNYIFSGEEGFYRHSTVFPNDKYYTNEEFKEWIGMTKYATTKEKLASILNNEGQQVLDYLEGKVVNKMPKLVAGRHYVRFSNGRFGQVMDGYINYVSIGEDAWDIRITGWDLVGDSVAGAIVEVFDNVFSNSNQYTHLDYFNSGKITIWKKEDERKQRIEQELGFAKAKAERLASHIAVLESKLK
jgi:hypothetical protein